jgi:hypothetical protein
MLRPLLPVFTLGAAAACTDAGSNHAAQSVNHSEASVVHGSAAVGDTVTSVRCGAVDRFWHLFGRIRRRYSGVCHWPDACTNACTYASTKCPPAL